MKKNMSKVKDVEIYYWSLDVEHRVCIEDSRRPSLGARGPRHGATAPRRAAPYG